MLAVGSHDHTIDIYSSKCVERAQQVNESCELRPLRRLKGHHSYITHIDWSTDNKLLQSNCGGYEILYWDIANGSQKLSSIDTLEADTKWNSFTCVLGFPVMGIWHPDSDGTDVNSVDVSFDKGILATGDDFGKVTIFNYPCIVKNAPGRMYSGHSSHVMNAKFLHSGKALVTVGGNDCSVMLWSVSR
jgi:WD40 repeat protein